MPVLYFTQQDSRETGKKVNSPHFEEEKIALLRPKRHNFRFGLFLIVFRNGFQDIMRGEPN